VVERRDAELAVGRFDAAPLDREPIVGQSQRRRDADVLVEAVVAVAGVAARLLARAVRLVLPLPPVVVDVAALDLVGGGGGTPDEAVGETGHGLAAAPWPKR
jgi:hypothetical protein